MSRFIEDITQTQLEAMKRAGIDNRVSQETYNNLVSNYGKLCRARAKAYREAERIFRIEMGIAE